MDGNQTEDVEVEPSEHIDMTAVSSDNSNAPPSEESQSQDPFGKSEDEKQVNEENTITSNQTDGNERETSGNKVENFGPEGDSEEGKGSAESGCEEKIGTAEGGSEEKGTAVINENKKMTASDNQKSKEIEVHGNKNNKAAIGDSREKDGTTESENVNENIDGRDSSSLREESPLTVVVLDENEESCNQESFKDDDKLEKMEWDALGNKDGDNVDTEGVEDKVNEGSNQIKSDEISLEGPATLLCEKLLTDGPPENVESEVKDGNKCESTVSNSINGVEMVNDCETIEKDGGKTGHKSEEVDEEIVEVPVYKKPAEVVDLSNEEEAGDKNKKSVEGSGGSDESNVDGNGRIKLRSLASLVDSTSSQDIPAIGEIVEHGVIIGSDEMDGLQLRISNVVGGEDCITGLTLDEDRDSFPSIQISSVTTLIEPISPEDPNKESSKSDENEKSDSKEGKADGSSIAQNSSAAEKGIKIVNSESLTSKETIDGNKTSTEGQLDTSDASKDANDDSQKTTGCVYHVLRSILTVNRDCLVCGKSSRCEFRVTKKGESGTWGFLCGSQCRTQWTDSLPADHQVEKPRLIFEKLCGMCGKDLANVNRSGQFSWETREFCSRKCLTQHLKEVAGECHMCREEVRAMFIGKYCVRFGSDIHQFCSNSCLERYKTKIKVCCYCQKNLEKVKRVTSMANKEYCSMKCLKRAQRRDIGQQNYSEQHPCTVCVATGLNRYEFLSNQETFQLCSDPCLNVYKYANKVKAVSCCLCFRVMNAEDVGHYLYQGGLQLRVFCSDSCVNVFILSARKIVVCNYCKVKKYNFDMIHRQVDEDFRDYFYCSLNCLNMKEPPVGKKPNNSVTPNSTTNNDSQQPSESSENLVTTCNMCNALAKPQYHMVMSDNTLRSFCRYTCASKYKTTYGFQINGMQNSETTQTDSSVPVLRSKTTTDVTASAVVNSENVSKSKSNSANAVSQSITGEAAAELLSLLNPPMMANKMTSCRPATLTKGVYCKPHPWHRYTQTDPKPDGPPVLPIPVPFYIPAPMMMYSSPFPVPLFVPIPVPVPIFIPTTAKTTEDLKSMMKKIQDEMPSDPYEAEMLLLARASEEEGRERQEDNPNSPSTHQSTLGAEGSSDDMQCVNISCLDTIEDDLPRYPLRLMGEDVEGLGGEGQLGESRGKRRAPHSPSSTPAEKRKRNNSDDFQSWFDPDYSEVDVELDTNLLPECENETEAEPLMEDFQSPFLNKLYGLAAWKHWVTGKNAELSGVSSSRCMKLFSEDLLIMNCEELNYALCLFLKDLRKPSGESYQPDTIFYLLLGIQQHLFDSSRTDCIFMDFGFEKFTNCFDEITKTFLSQSLSPSSGMGVTRVTETMLWECRQLGAHTPQVLLNTLFYFNTKVFKLKTVEEHQSLSFAQIVKQWKRTSVGRDGSVTRTIILRFYPKKSSDGQAKRVNDMHENRDDPLRCPVKLYEFYLSKCPESVRSQRSMYYVYPERSCVPDSPTWFSTQTVQATSLSKMLHRALMVREVQEALGE